MARVESEATSPIKDAVDIADISCSLRPARRRGCKAKSNVVPLTPEIGRNQEAVREGVELATAVRNGLASLTPHMEASIVVDHVKVLLQLIKDPPESRFARRSLTELENMVMRQISSFGFGGAS